MKNTSFAMAALAATSLLLSPVYADEEQTETQTQNTYRHAYQYDQSSANEDALQTRERLQTREQVRDEQLDSDHEPDQDRTRAQSRDNRPDFAERSSESRAMNMSRMSRGTGRGAGSRH